MVGNGCFEFLPLARDFYKTRAFWRTDPFDAAASELPLVGHIEQPIFETCRTKVCD
jgi:hypothetical protein